MKASIALGGLTMAAGMLVPVLSTATAAVAATCGGQVATVVGMPGQDQLSGTTGPDVIVSNGARRVDAAEGEDLVCLTNGDAVVTLDGDYEYDDTGTWADDRVIGSNGNDVISSGNSAGDYFDILQTTENGDVLNLGTGDSTVYMEGVPVGSIDGGTGRDRLFTRGSGDQLTVEVDTSMTFSGRPKAGLGGIESFHLENAGFDSLEFTGSAASESLYTNPGFSEIGGQNPDTVTITLGGGDDVVALAADVQGTVAGGQGNDQFRYTASEGGPRRTQVLLRNGAVEATRLRATVNSFSGLYSDIRDITVVGDARRNEVSVRACTVRVRAGAGDDLVAITTIFDCDKRPHVAYGGAGRDQLTGGRGQDLLVGGPGRDRADGRARSDRCVAEVRRNCER